MSARTATYVGPGKSGHADQRVYRLDPPIEWSPGLDEPTETTEYVVVSAVDESWATETYIFPSDASGEILDWLELDGSFRGGTDHRQALLNAGYEAQS